METREFEMRLSDMEERTVTGIAVPYNETITVGGIREKFIPGAFGDISDVKLFAGHKDPIGVVRSGEDTENGYLIEARISRTPRGDEVLTLLRDGVLNKFSVGFEPVEDRDEDGVTVRAKARLREVSVVAFPAYENASVLSVRESDPIQKEEAVEAPIIDVEARERLDDLDRTIAVLAERGSVNPVDDTPSYRTYGEFVQAVARGDEDAVRLTRAFAGGVTGATIAAPDPIVKNAWVLETIRLVDSGRPTLNAFRSDPLPAEGMNVEWPQVKTDTLKVDEQAAEADVLAFGRLTLESKTSPVKTIGGYTAMSRQAIERSSYSYLDTVWRALALHYGKQTNKEVVTALEAATGLATASLAASPTAKSVGGLIVDAAIALDSQGFNADFILVSSDQFKVLATLTDTTDRPLLAAANQVNNPGSAALPRLSASLFGLPVILDTSLKAKSIYIASREALVTWQSGGAPWRLADEDITNLTKEFSLYGYMSVGIPHPLGIVKTTAA